MVIACSCVRDVVCCGLVCVYYDQLGTPCGSSRSRWLQALVVCCVGLLLNQLISALCRVCVTATLHVLWKC